MTITPFSPFFYFIWKFCSFLFYTLSGQMIFIWQQQIWDRQLIRLSTLFCQPNREKQENMIKLKSRRIEYFRTMSRRVSFTTKPFCRLVSVRCAENSNDDRLRCRELPGPWVMTTVFMATKSIFMAIKTVIIAENRQKYEKWSVLPSKKRYPNFFIIKSDNC